MALLVVLFNPMLVLELSFNRTYSLNPCLLWIGKSSAVLRSILIGRLTCSVLCLVNLFPVKYTNSLYNWIGHWHIVPAAGMPIQLHRDNTINKQFSLKEELPRKSHCLYSNKTRFCAIRAGFVMDILGYVIGGNRFRSLECMIKVFTKNGDNFLSMRVYAKCIYEAFLVATQETHQRTGFNE